MNLYLSIILPTLVEAVMPIVGTLLMGMLMWTAAKAKSKFGIEIEAKHREALHSALISGIQLALSRQLSPFEAVNAARDYVHKSVPDALAKLSPTPEVLTGLIMAKLQEVATDAAASIVVAPATEAVTDASMANLENVVSASAPGDAV